MESPPHSRRLLLRKEGLCLLVVLAVLGLAAVFYPLAPVGTSQGEEVAAPWVFLGLQELLRRLPARLAGLVLPALALALLALLPWLAGRAGEPAPLPTWRRRWRPAEYLAWALVAVWVALTLLGAG